MASEVEGTFKIGDVSLYTKTYTPPTPIKAKLIFLHGFSDHIGRYEELFRHLVSHGIQVFGFDQRGWGRSVAKPSHKGLTGSTAQVLADIAAFISSKLPSDEPVFVFGHSMGGGEALALASTPEHKDVVSQVRGWILEAPFLGFPPGEEPSALKVMLGRVAGKLFPRRPLIHRIAPEKLAHDPAVQKSLAEDTLCHDTGTLEGLAGLLDRTVDLASGKLCLLPDVKSVYVAHGTKDQATGYDSSKKWFDAQTRAVDDATFKTFEDCAHQLHADECKLEFFKEVTDWILERIGEPIPSETEAAAPAAAAAAEPQATTADDAADDAVDVAESKDAAKTESKL
ncbi:hypothetical protein jhhlp_001794 [Lomentospora prolificans]|uniref:Serine aminopeptidase S33 domain-containing protein n=1 Tax=Lomentospora prolificans TaxID=41688 RepID=A0A2N3NGS5_9PEZI|nr:hypothetical protein jhhlp_001794 [Lomentospora prolificans]